MAPRPSIESSQHDTEAAMVRPSPMMSGLSITRSPRSATLNVSDRTPPWNRRGLASRQKGVAKARDRIAFAFPAQVDEFFHAIRAPVESETRFTYLDQVSAPTHPGPHTASSSARLGQSELALHRQPTSVAPTSPPSYALPRGGIDPCVTTFSGGRGFMFPSFASAP